MPPGSDAKEEGRKRQRSPPSQRQMMYGGDDGGIAPLQLPHISSSGPGPAYGRPGTPLECVEALLRQLFRDLSGPQIIIHVFNLHLEGTRRAEEGYTRVSRDAKPACCQCNDSVTPAADGRLSATARARHSRHADSSAIVLQSCSRGAMPRPRAEGRKDSHR